MKSGKVGAVDEFIEVKPNVVFMSVGRDNNDLWPKGLRRERNGGKLVNHWVKDSEFVRGRMERKAMNRDAGLNCLSL